MIIHENQTFNIIFPCFYKVKQLDETYKVTERAQAISAQAIAKAQEYDAKYDIITKVNSYLSNSINKTKEIDQTYQVLHPRNSIYEPYLTSLS